MKDSLWLRRVQHYYLKRTTVWECNAQNDSSWYWRRLLNVRDQMRGLLQDDKIGWLAGKNYTIAQGYKSWKIIQDSVHQSCLVWSRYKVHKFSLITWMAMHIRLLTQDRLIQRGVAIANRCLLCEANEESNEQIVNNKQSLDSVVAAKITQRNSWQMEVIQGKYPKKTQQTQNIFDSDC